MLAIAPPSLSQYFELSSPTSHPLPAAFTPAGDHKIAVPKAGAGKERPEHAAEASLFGCVVDQGISRR
jgi:hypothetical protein